MSKEAMINRTLLIIDDDKNTLKAIERALSREGYQIHTFTRVVDALVTMQEVKFGVIMSDQCMPHMDGTEFLKLANRYQPDAIRIILSGYYDSHSVAQVVEESCAWRYIPKPWDDEELKNTLKSAFERFDKLHIL